MKRKIGIGIIVKHVEYILAEASMWKLAVASKDKLANSEIKSSITGAFGGSINREMTVTSMGQQLHL